MSRPTTTDPDALDAYAVHRAFTRPDITTQEAPMSRAGDLIAHQQRAARTAPADAESACRLCGRTAPMDAERVANWRVCADCVPIVRANDLGLLWSVLLREHVTHAEGRALTETLTNPARFLDGDPAAKGDRKPWQHVSGDTVKAARRSLAMIRDNAKPRPSDTGKPCAWCGVVESVEWQGYGLRWPDGTQGVLCDACTPTARRYGFPQHDPELSAVLTAVVDGGLPLMGHGRPEVVAYATTGGAGQAVAWSHVPVVAP